MTVNLEVQRQIFLASSGSFGKVSDDRNSAMDLAQVTSSRLIWLTSPLVLAIDGVCKVELGCIRLLGYFPGLLLVRLVGRP